MLYRAAQHTSPANRSWGVLSNPLGAAANDFIESTSAPHLTWTASAGGDGRGHDPSIVQLAPHHQSAAPRPTRGLCTPCPVAQSVCQRLACLLALHSRPCSPLGTSVDGRFGGAAPVRPSSRVERGWRHGLPSTSPIHPHQRLTLSGTPPPPPPPTGKSTLHGGHTRRVPRPTT